MSTRSYVAPQRIHNATTNYSHFTRKAFRSVRRALFCGNNIVIQKYLLRYYNLAELRGREGERTSEREEIIYYFFFHFSHTYFSDITLFYCIQKSHTYTHASRIILLHIIFLLSFFFVVASICISVERLLHILARGKVFVTRISRLIPIYSSMIMIYTNYEARRMSWRKESSTFHLNLDYDNGNAVSCALSSSGWFYAYKARLLYNNFYQESSVRGSARERETSPPSSPGSNDVFARVSRLSGLHDEPFVIENPLRRNRAPRTSHHRPSISTRLQRLRRFPNCR